MNPQDNPHFTAYALGELSAEEARALHEMLATTPSAAHELEQIEAVTDALRHGAPIPQSRLTHEQRHAVLHPANLPRRIQPMMPRKPVPRPNHTFWPVVGVMLKAAAVIALTGAAFLAGWSFSPTLENAAEVVTAPLVKPEAPVVVVAKPQRAPTPVVAVVAQPKSETKHEVPAPVVPTVAVATAPVPVPVVKEAMVVAQAPASLTAPKVAASPKSGFTMPAGSGAFASTTKQANDLFSLRPSQIRPAAQKASGQAFASPLPAGKKSADKPPRVSELFIHSWQAEVAACPWNAAHRLLRIVIQLPADQPAVIAADAGFPLQVNFDPGSVKQYRMLCERHVAAAELRSAGTHMLWYEFQPNGSDTAGGRQIASVTLPNARFTTQTVGPFDGSKLLIIDRGYSLKNARDDFVFESAVVGFGLLLRGAEQPGNLNHALVLDLAKQAKSADSSGERARFIRLVQDAQHATGL